MKLSIITTLYHSEPYVEQFCDRAAAAAQQLTEDYEIVLVNDGSPDRSLQVARRYADTHLRIKVIDLSRNFGHHKAMMTGLAHARGKFVFLIDSDLEEEPEWLLEFWKLLQEGEVDVVYGVQTKRRGGLLDRVLGYLYYVVFRAVTDLSIPLNFVTARLMTRRYVDALISFQESEIDIAGLWASAGFDQRPCPVVKSSTSQTTYTLSHKVNLLIDSITSFSSFPLVVIFYFGLLVSMTSAAFLFYLLICWTLLDRPPSGWTSMIGSLWLLGGLMIFFLGVIGIYLSKVFSETKRRPNTIIRNIYSSPTKAEASGPEARDAE